MTNEIESEQDKFEDIQIEMPSAEVLYTLSRNYIQQTMSAASLSKFDEVFSQRETTSLEEAVAAAVINEAIVQIAIDAADAALKRTPIPPFNI